MRRMLAAALYAAACGAAQAAETNTLVETVRDWVAVNAYADVESAYWARGKIVDARPYSSQFADVDLKLGEFGQVGGHAWSVSSFAHNGQTAGRRNAYNEVDWNLHYEYTYDFTEDGSWGLWNRVARQWVTLPGYFPDCKTILEWHVSQALVNPYVTPYYLLRRATEPQTWCYWQIGARHTFALDALAKDLSFTVNFFGDCGDARHYLSQYGAKPDDPESRYHGGLMALNLVFRLDYKLCENCGLFAYVQQFDIVDDDARDTVKASTAAESKRDLTIGGVGVAVSF